VNLNRALRISPAPGISAGPWPPFPPPITCLAGGMGGQRDGWMGGFAKVDNVFLRLGGLANVDNGFGYEKWLQGGS